LIIGALPLASFAQNAAHTLSGGLSTGYESLHIFRGVDSAADESIVWTSGTLTMDSASSIGFWYGTGPNSVYEELDLVGSQRFAFDWADLTLGVVWYHFPDDFADDSVDFSVTLSRDYTLESGLVLTPALAVVYNESAEGFYVQGGITATQPLTERLQIVAQGWVAGSSSYRQDDGLDNATLLVSAPFQLTESASLSPFIGASAALDAIDDTSDDELWGGVTLNVQF